MLGFHGSWAWANDHSNSIGTTRTRRKNSRELGPGAIKTVGQERGWVSAPAAGCLNVAIRSTAEVPRNKPAGQCNMNPSVAEKERRIAEIIDEMRELLTARGGDEE